MKRPPTEAPAPKSRRKPAPELLREAATRARAEGKRLLVLVIPEDAGLRYERGQLLGEYLNHGSDADLAPLASAVVICARVADLNAELGASLRGQPVMAMHDPRQGTWKALDAEIPPHASEEYPRRGSGSSAQEKAMEESINRRIGAVAGLVRAGLGEAPAPEIGRLAGEARAATVKKPPPGGRWAQAMGCGVSYEEPEDKDEERIVGCGMGFVPKRSQRFLDFLVASAKP
jgi:hypothetical protein